jgi:hypothetical protein
MFLFDVLLSYNLDLQRARTMDEGFRKNGHKRRGKERYDLRKSEKEFKPRRSCRQKREKQKKELQKGESARPTPQQAHVGSLRNENRTLRMLLKSKDRIISQQAETSLTLLAALVLEQSRRIRIENRNRNQRRKKGNSEEERSPLRAVPF